MACRCQKIILFCLLFLVSCTKETQVHQVIIDQPIENGDIVLRREDGFVSSLFSSYASKAGVFSHVGIVVVDSVGEISVLHCEMEETKEPSSVRIESIENFLALADTFAVYRLEYPLEVRDEVVNKAMVRNARGARFDFDFNNSTDSLLYCTELIAKSINDALGDSVIQPTTIFLEKPCFSLDDLTTHCILIK
ncbi:MAG: YiiX/YebB-like N1pC/P60 family cysteine hydrolase [Paludibacteraceae bacterium]|nr:YiiX/YebB-like N1pC/P60 family cysteine hydrolase [Paludibacteraceae bacterium]